MYSHSFKKVSGIENFHRLPFWESAYHCVRDEINSSRPENRNSFVYDFRINKWAISVDSHKRLCFFQSCHLSITLSNIFQRASMAFDFLSQTKLLNATSSFESNEVATTIFFNSLEHPSRSIVHCNIGFPARFFNTFPGSLLDDIRAWIIASTSNPL